VASLGDVSTVHMYVLCPGPPLPKEIPGQHRRLAKRDTRVCEAHSKQERRALRRNLIGGGPPNPYGAPPTSMMGTYTVMRQTPYAGMSMTAPVPMAMAPVMTMAGGGHQYNPGHQYQPGPPINPHVIAVELERGTPPVLCSVGREVSEAMSGSAVGVEWSKGSTNGAANGTVAGAAAAAAAASNAIRSTKCCVPGCQRTAVDFHVGE
jgi:hypothetical protein